MSRSQLFIGRLSKDVRTRELEDVFSRYGKLMRCDIKYGAAMAYAFVDYEDRRDAEDAIRYENGRDIRGHQICVEWAKGPNYRYGSGRDVERRGGGGGSRYREERPRRRRSYSRSRSRSRSRSPRRRRRSPSRSRSRSRSRSHSLSADRDVKRRSKSRSKSRDKSKSKSPSKSRSPTPRSRDGSRSPAADKSPKREEEVNGKE